MHLPVLGLKDLIALKKRSERPRSGGHPGFLILSGKKPLNTGPIFFSGVCKSAADVRDQNRLQFLEDFRLLQDRRPPAKTRLISLRIDETLLERLRKSHLGAALPNAKLNP